LEQVYIGRYKNAFYKRKPLTQDSFLLFWFLRLFYRLKRRILVFQILIFN